MPARWPELHRILGIDESNIQGPWHYENAPYLRGMMNIILAPGVSQANIIKSGQAGVSELLRNVLGYLAHMEPDPVGLCLPDRAKGRKIVKQRVIPMFQRVKVLRDLLSPASHDTQLEQLRLANGFLLHLMWSGSASATASDPMRVIMNDEVDKMARWSASGEPGIIGRTWTRTETYGNRALQVNVSTPTTTAGLIWQLFDASDVKLYFHVPCPLCGHWQRLLFGQLKYTHYDVPDAAGERPDKNSCAARIIRHRAAWYECANCRGRIEESHKAGMVRAGQWRSERGPVADYWGHEHIDAEQVRRWPDGTRVGMSIWSAYTLWDEYKWPKIAAAWVRARGDFAAEYSFRTETEGEPFQHRVQRFMPSVFEAKSLRSGLPRGVVPRWAWLLLASIDTQKDHFYAVIRAWGGGFKSARIWHGKLASFDQLHRLIYETTFPVEGNAAEPMDVLMAVIDTGGTRMEGEDISRTMQVYQWVLPRQTNVRAIKGAARLLDGRIFRLSRDAIGPAAERRSEKRQLPPGLDLWMVDTHKCNDILADLILRGTPRPDPPAAAAGAEPAPVEPETWLLDQENDPEYNSHMAAMVKTPESVGRKVVERWVPTHSGIRYDYRHCEAYQIAAAYMQNVEYLPNEDELARLRAEQETHPAAPASSPDDGDQRDPQERVRRSDAWKPRPMDL